LTRHQVLLRALQLLHLRPQAPLAAMRPDLHM